MNEIGDIVDKKLKIKYRKSENKYIVDYSKTSDTKQVRFELLEQLNNKEDAIVYIDTSLNKADEKYAKGLFYDLTKEDSRDMIIKYLEESGFEFEYRFRKRELVVTLLGFSTSKKDIVEDTLMIIIVPKGTMTNEFFNYLLCTHDYMMGIKPTNPTSTYISDFLTNDFKRIDTIEGFTYKLVDSHFMRHFYTGYPFEV
jgi:hypothetical protein